VDEEASGSSGCSRASGASGTLPFEWAVAGRPRRAGDESGDRHLVAPTPCGALVAVVDGLGHGDEAAAAAEIATHALSQNRTEPVPSLVRRCHEALRGTRGAAMTLAIVDAGAATLTWGGIGNVEGRLVRVAAPERAEGPLLLGGVVGYRIPQLRPTVTPLSAGDLFILSTDGITPHYVEGLVLSAGLQAIADRILRIHGRDDDALVLVARWSGVGTE
jgi:negative regulator of sigma-B (phosphoserine phosphatase)